MTTRHHLTLGETEHHWEVDAAAVGAVMPWAQRSRATLAADLEGMARYFPHWLLVGARGGRPLQCAGCNAPQVPTGGAIRCPVCAAAARADGLLWAGHLPALARPEPAFAARRAALRAAGFDEVSAGDASYLLVPLVISYPAEWPSVEAPVAYAPRWLAALGLPQASSATHMLGGGRACLFSYGQWRAMPIHALLQQRVVNHLASLLKIAAGIPPATAFVGRIHHDAWEPER